MKKSNNVFVPEYEAEKINLYGLKFTPYLHKDYNNGDVIYIRGYIVSNFDGVLDLAGIEYTKNNNWFKIPDKYL